MAGIRGVLSELSNARQDMIRSVLRSDKLLRWITNEESSVLLPNGKKHSEDKKDISEFAASTSARIASDLEGGYIGGNSKRVPLYFFCGAHPHRKDPKRNSPIGIANNFIGQLLQKVKSLDLTEALNLEHVEGLSSTFEALKVFETVLAQLEAKVTVYFIIDDITSYCCNGQLLQDTAELLNKLIGLMQKPPGGVTCRIKLLITAPGWTPPEAYRIDNSNVLTIPVGNESKPGEKALDNATENV